MSQLKGLSLFIWTTKKHASVSTFRRVFAQRRANGRRLYVRVEAMLIFLPLVYASPTEITALI